MDYNIINNKAIKEEWCYSLLQNIEIKFKILTFETTVCLASNKCLFYNIILINFWHLWTLIFNRYKFFDMIFFPLKINFQLLLKETFRSRLFYLYYIFLIFIILNF